jgi:hypothetical protein
LTHCGEYLSPTTRLYNSVLRVFVPQLFVLFSSYSVLNQQEIYLWGVCLMTFLLERTNASSRRVLVTQLSDGVDSLVTIFASDGCHYDHSVAFCRFIVTLPLQCDDAAIDLAEGLRNSICDVGVQSMISKQISFLHRMVDTEALWRAI